MDWEWSSRVLFYLLCVCLDCVVLLWVNESDRKHSVPLNLDSFTVWNELSLMCDKKYDPKWLIRIVNINSSHRVFTCPQVPKWKSVQGYSSWHWAQGRVCLHLIIIMVNWLGFSFESWCLFCLYLSSFIKARPTHLFSASKLCDCETFSYRI